MKIKKTIFRLFVLALFLFTSGVTVQAQENLMINTVFEKYGKQKGATMVILSGKALHNYHLDKYRSITLQYDRPILEEILRYLSR